MKCRSVACIWSGKPPSHRVTATAALNHPATLYTGGSDGSILWWTFSDSNSEIKPIAMLCGHAAPIADLGICYPVSGYGKAENFGNIGVNSSLDNGALISACTDGVLCVWSRSSGHCRRRRKLPPWFGSPSIICTLPSNPRYICIGCCFVDSIQLSDLHSFDSVEGDAVSMDKEVQNRKPTKCSVVVVDTYGLTIVQTIFHGNLSIGLLKYMAVVPMGEDREKHSALLVDSFGRLQLVPILKESHQNGEWGNGLHKSSSQQGVAISADELVEGEQYVSLETCGNIIALLLKDRCIFKLLDSGNTIGLISFVDNLFSLEEYSTRTHVIGGLFLKSSNTEKTVNTKEALETFSEKFAVWNNRGSAVVYVISYMNDEFKCEPYCEIPSVSYPTDCRYSISFIQMNLYLLRIESVCFHVEEPAPWRPYVTIWSLQQKNNGHGKLCRWSRMVGEGFSFVDWIDNSTLFNEIEGFSDDKNNLTCWENTVPYSKNTDNIQADFESDGFVHREKVVSSSMVISENLYAPYAIVYGFFSGEIEVLRFDFFEGLDSPGASPRLRVESPVSRHSYSGHTAPVLCLAAHRMVGTAKGWSFNQVLISGSMDCTICIWDLCTGNLITVMHQHVAPVRQIILPPARTEHPWSDCFLSVGEDACISLSSLETLRVERMFPGHPSYPAKVVWDGPRGYIACLCRDRSRTSDSVDVLFIWDVKTGARERVLRGMASHSMFDHFCKGISMNSSSGAVLNGNTSVSSLLLPIHEDGNFSQSHLHNFEKGATLSNIAEPSTSEAHVSKGHSGKLSPNTLFVLQSKKQPIKCSCPYPGIAAFSFDLAALMFPCQKLDSTEKDSDKQENTNMKEQGTETPSPHRMTVDDGSAMHGISPDNVEDHDWIKSLEEFLLRFSMSFLHLWSVDSELDKLLISDMKLKRPENFIVASGLQGEKGSLTLTFPGVKAILELWKSSSEFCAMRSLTMVSLAQRMVSLCHSTSAASSALSAFYTRNFADRVPDIKPPLLQLLVSFWQNESEHVRMAARSLFHCAASRAIPLPLCSGKAAGDAKFVRSLSTTENDEHEIAKIELTSRDGSDSEWSPETQGISQVEEINVLAWLESFEVQDWISCVGGTSQDAMTSHIIVAAALSIWYPSLVKPTLATLVVHPLMKLSMAINEKYSSTAAELLAEGMESTWMMCIGSEIHRLIGDIFFQIECVSGPSSNPIGEHAVPASIRETLVGTLLPSLAMADILGFLTVVESQIWSTASDSPVHLVSLKTIIRVVRGSPRSLAQYLDKVVNFILQTIDPGNSVMRKTCLQSSMAALKEVVRVFPMVALNDTSTKLAVGDVMGEINNPSIRVYDMQSVIKIKVLDASGPPGLPSLLSGASETMVTTAISALSFSLDGEGLVAFSEHGLMIRWWSLGSLWWEKLSRNFVPVQCTKLIFVPPSEGFSPKSTRSSVMANIMGHDGHGNLQENASSLSYADSLKLVIHNLDLSYRLEWVGERKVLLTRHGLELGTFQL
ncbi:hypothetical protein LWI28_027904 [Acer negundo]|uniref:Transducin/WD40 repeat-like superfamily protein n=1 Tax=Acer negundo TaxID=4023 RepID=A0AAD5IST4_ACENE|nr:hypothetical protein LWI28_027904 [Acer negundo]